MSHQFPPVTIGNGRIVLPGQAPQAAAQQVVPRINGAVQRRGADPQAFGHLGESEITDADLQRDGDDVLVSETRFRTSASARRSHTVNVPVAHVAERR